MHSLTFVSRRFGGRKESKILRVLGIALFFVSLLMIPALVVSIINKESIMYIAVPMVIGIVISLFLMLRYKSVKSMRPTDGLLMIFAMWAMFFIIGVIPYLIHGLKPVDALFESVSGFTTAGATTLTNIPGCPHGLLIWRSTTQWIGGIIIVIMFMLIIPMVVSGGRGVLQNEMSGSGGGNLFVKLGSAAKEFIFVYVILTVIFFVTLMLIGLTDPTFNTLDAATISLSVISTGGFTVRSDSFASYSILIKLVVLVFMLLSATNFYLMYRSIGKREFGKIGRNEEFRAMIAWFGCVSILICAQMLWNHKTSGDTLNSIVDVVFSVVSMGTTTGFTTTDYAGTWTFAATSILMILMLIGGSSGSTAGGIKITRAIIIVKSLINELKLIIHPNAVTGIKLNHRGVDSSVVHSATIVAVVFILTVGVSTVVFDIIGGESITFDKAFFTSISFISGTGIGMEEFANNYSSMSGFGKVFACLLMFLGRMEIVTVLAVLTPGFWKETLGAQKIHRIKRRSKKTQNLIVGSTIDKLRPVESDKKDDEKIGEDKRK